MSLDRKAMKEYVKRAREDSKNEKKNQLQSVEHFEFLLDDLLDLYIDMYAVFFYEERMNIDYHKNGHYKAKTRRITRKQIIENASPEDLEKVKKIIKDEILIYTTLLKKLYQPDKNGKIDRDNPTRKEELKTIDRIAKKYHYIIYHGILNPYRHTHLKKRKPHEAKLVFDKEHIPFKNKHVELLVKLKQKAEKLDQNNRYYENIGQQISDEIARTLTEMDGIIEFREKHGLDPIEY